MKLLRRCLVALLAVVVLLIAVVGGYLIYAFATYYRLDDNLALTPENNQSQAARTGEEYTLVSYNVGFGAYSPDYSFFMDGGKYSRAFSADAVKTNIAGAGAQVAAEDPDFVFLEEVDTDATRSYHIDQRPLLESALPGYGSVFAQNYDSPYLFWPLNSPHGKSVAGMLTLTRYQIDSAVRYSLPVETGFSKFMDLDRCYSVTKVPVEGGKSLCLFTTHLSAYTTDGTIATEQVKVLAEAMSKEYAAGNYVICGGDFNKDLLGDSGAIFGVSGAEYTWAQPFPAELIPAGLTLTAPYDPANPVPSCRNANEVYDTATSFVLTIDGFIVSDNVKVASASVIDTGFQWSDHNPVKLVFSLT